ncbi:hypothetical protein [Sporisorium scitamineum]|uniref:Uncharacterized protein n=1 Tax=Sporisorium scitamineum TaxID=49012 RepID=A0A0F7RZQ6_9BASI|nr:hypothetical protein [Sporisorium scitamineum]
MPVHTLAPLSRAPEVESTNQQAWFDTLAQALAKHDLGTNKYAHLLRLNTLD